METGYRPNHQMRQHLYASRTQLPENTRTLSPRREFLAKCSAIVAGVKWVSWPVFGQSFNFGPPSSSVDAISFRDLAKLVNTRFRVQAAPGRVVELELMEARLLFEPALADLVVTHATPADFSRMEECLTRGARAGSVAEFEEWDAALHQAIAAATHNSFVIRMLDNINAVREQSEWGQLKQRSLTPERRAVYHLEHKRLVDAL